MRTELVPIEPTSMTLDVDHRGGPSRSASFQPPEKNPLDRPLAAMRRYKWLMLAVVVASTLLGVVGLRLVIPQYEVHGIVWLETETPDNQGRNGPIRSGNLLSASAWVQLLKSYRVVDGVV